MADLTALQAKISTILADIDLRFDEPMSNHTSFRIGGKVEVI